MVWDRILEWGPELLDIAGHRAMLGCNQGAHVRTGDGHRSWMVRDGIAEMFGEILIGFDEFQSLE